MLISISQIIAKHQNYKIKSWYALIFNNFA